MKVSSKITSGFLILILLTVAVLAYQVYIIREMQEINAELSEINVSSAIAMVRITQTTSLLRDNSVKYLAVLDLLYACQITALTSIASVAGVLLDALEKYVAKHSSFKSK